MKTTFILAVGFLILAFSGCSATTAEHAAEGAVVGAVSVTFVDAVTDLIVDGRVNTDRLARRAVRGAVAGGLAGGIAGAEKTRQEELRQQAAAPVSPPPSTADAAYQNLEREIGKENMQGLEALVQCRLEEAYRVGLQTEKSTVLEYREAGLVLQALADQDRGNAEGVSRSLQEVVAINPQLNDMSVAMNEFNKLYDELLDERKVHGLSPRCQ